MPAHYSVIRYVPDPIADERINLGVIIFGEGQVLSRFITKWQRARNFGGEDIVFLQEFAKEVAERQMKLLPGAPLWDEHTLQKIAGHWKNSIQLSEPRGSLQSPEGLLTEVVQRYLHEPLPVRRGTRDKRAAISRGYEALQQALFDRFMHVPAKILKRQYPLKGELDEHSFAIVVGNGRPVLGAEALSFEGSYTKSLLQKDIDATLWAVDDVRKANANLPLAILALPPRRETALYRNARRVFRQLDADFVPEERVERWAKSIVRTLPIPKGQQLVSSRH